MREIKFRVWYKDVQRMSTCSSCLLANDLNNPNKEVMQFTGLKDRKGKEIYEGDILKTDNYNGKHYWLVIYGEDYMGAFSCFKVDCIDLPHEISSVHSRVIDDGEIIGNKFENPELLR